MTRPRTHRERAREAVHELRESRPHLASHVIARATYPTELVQALRYVQDHCILYGPADQAREKIRSALDLYEEEDNG